MKNFIITIVFVAAIFFSCNNKKSEIFREKLIIPNTLTIYSPFTGYTMDSTSMVNARLKIYSSVNFSCATCFPQIEDWNNIIRKELNKGIAVILIGHADDKFRVMEFACAKGIVKPFPFPFLIDSAGTFEKHIQSNKAIVTDQDNNILFEAEPLKTPEARQEFIEKLSILYKNQTL